MSQHRFTHIRVKGSPYERGLHYGMEASMLIQKNIAVYAAYFDYIAGWAWTQAREYALSYEPVINEYRPHFIDEMAGIAAGAKAAGSAVTYPDILALNVRTEIRNSAIARLLPLECTAFVVLPDRTYNSHTLIGQNWDWFKAVADTVVVLEVEAEDGPNFITVVEAGLLAKAGMNAAGIGLATNALNCDLDKDTEPGVPYHAILRAILESQNFSQAIGSITSHRRGSSANYLVAHKDGVFFNAETAPGDFSRAFFTFIEEDIYAHTNHFLDQRIDFKDLAPWYGPSSLVRHHRMHKFLRSYQGVFTLQNLKDALCDHFNFPEAICSHPNPDDPETDQSMTVVSLIMDLDQRRLFLAAGNPCQSQYQEIKYDQFL